MTNQTETGDADAKIGANPEGTTGLPSMSPDEATAAIKKQQAEWAASAETDKTVTYYPYAEVTRGATKLLAYTGKPVTVEANAAQPDNTLQWAPVTCGPNVAVYNDNGVWHAGYDLATLTLAQMREIALSAVLRTFEAAVNALTANYSPLEQKSWALQVALARGLINNGTASDTLNTLAKARGINVKVLAQKILDKDTAYQHAYLAALVTFQVARDSINAATKVEDLPALTVEDLSLVNYVAAAAS